MALPYQAHSSFEYLPTPMELLHRIEQIVYVGDSVLIHDETVSKIWGAEGGASHHGAFSDAVRARGLRVGFDATGFAYDVFNESGARPEGHTPRKILVTIGSFHFSEHTVFVIAPSEAVFFTWKRLSTAELEGACLLRNPAWLGSGYPKPKGIIFLGYPAFLGRKKADRVMAASKRNGYVFREPRPDELLAANARDREIAQALGIAASAEASPPPPAAEREEEAQAKDSRPQTSTGELNVNWWELHQR